MKNNKGFTLTEVLAVIVILSIIIIIAYPSINAALTGAKSELSKLNKKTLEDSGQMFATDVYVCDTNGNIINVLKDILDADGINCKQAKEQLQNGINITVEKLQEYEYFIDYSSKCSGNMIIRMETDNKTTINLDDITCKG